MRRGSLLAGLLGGLFVACASHPEAPPCPEGLRLCGERCVDARVDRQHCGACDAPCAHREICDHGRCAVVCPPRTVLCGERCVDPTRDWEHCGASGDCRGPTAGQTCPPGEICDGTGVCALSCQTSFVECDGVCVDPFNDEEHCGASGDCRDAAAGVSCAPGEICDGFGQCATTCQGGLLECDGICIDPSRDEEHCGAFADCEGSAAGEICGPGELCDGRGLCALSCASGLVECADSCIDPSTDESHCGATAPCSGPDAGQTCDPGQRCEGGSCHLTCASPTLDCGEPHCVDPLSDPKHCGGCHNACGSGEGCWSGNCFPFGGACSPGQVTVTIPFSDVTGNWSTSGCCSQSDYMVGQGDGTSIAGSFLDPLPPDAVVSGLSLSVGVQHECSGPALEMTLNGTVVATLDDGGGPLCSCTSAPWPFQSSAVPSLYSAGATNTVSIVQAGAGSCHEALTTVPGAAAGTAFEVVIDYLCP